jgi:hypothetical protein
MVLFYTKFDVMVKFVFDEIEYVEIIEQLKDLELKIIIQQLYQLQSIIFNQIKIKGKIIFIPVENLSKEDQMIN